MAEVREGVKRADPIAATALSEGVTFSLGIALDAICGERTRPGRQNVRNAKAGMRKLFFAGVSWFSLALGASNVFAMGSDWSPPWSAGSPYALWRPESVAPPPGVPTADFGERNRAPFRSGQARERHVK